MILRKVGTVLFAVVVSTLCFAGSRDEPLVIVQNGKYGYIDHEGKITIPPRFLWADDFRKGLATAYVCGRYVSLDPVGALHPLRIAVEGHLEPQKKDNKYGFVDAAGQFKIAPQFDDILPFSEGFAAVQVNGKWGFINASGAVAIHPQFKSAYYFREGVATAESDSGSVLIDRSGKIVARGFDFPDQISDGRVPASQGDKAGFLDLAGQVVIPFVYDSVTSFSEGLAAVKKEGRWGYIDREGRQAIPFQLDSSGSFSNGLASAKKDGKSGFIDHSGKFAFTLVFDYAPGFFTGDEESGLFIAPSDVSRFWITDKQFGYVNTSGRIIWESTGYGPDHPPLFGWSEEAKTRSCEGFSQAEVRAVAGFPER